ncbi:uncharacterized protein LOC132268597 [Cornus florida]|uniref:uncharacterized protein LOC132268597 n=1 Tax=Cornus florida TaxID=4283 RepID=UPI00289FD3AC|nr:uncharacterized protein LOC132268597 [Cornus florida]
MAVSRPGEAKLLEAMWMMLQQESLDYYVVATKWRLGTVLLLGGGVASVVLGLEIDVGWEFEMAYDIFHDVDEVIEVVVRQEENVSEEVSEEGNVGEEMSEEENSANDVGGSEYSFCDSDDEDWTGVHEGVENLGDHNLQNIGLENEIPDVSSDGLSNYSENQDLTGESEDEIESNVTKGKGKKQTRTVDYLYKSLKGKLFKYAEGGKIEFEKGHIFDDIRHFREVLVEYSVQKGFNLVREKNETGRITCHCANQGCSWRIHATILADQLTYKVKSVGPEHTCIRISKLKSVTAPFIAKKLMEKFKRNPEINVKYVKEEVREKLLAIVSTSACWRARNIARDQILGNHSTSYKKLWKNVAEGPFGGILMSAIGLDGNNGLYPFVVAVVESETKDSWKWFLDHLHKFLGDTTTTNIPWTFMSDGQKGILTALSEIFPQAITRRCCRHIYANFRTRWPGVKYKKLFWEAVNAYNEEDFKIAMRQIELISQDASIWLMEHPLETWTRHKFDDRVKCDYVTNNHVESFNSWLENVRAKPITAVFECIRTKVMSKFNKRFRRTADWTTTVVPKIKKRLNSNISKAGTCELTWPAEGVYEVTDNAKLKSYIVMFGERTSCCREWQVSGVPCMHACAAITTTRVDIEKLCSDFYNKDTYTKTYTPFIHPMHDESMWTEVDKPELDPPKLKRPCGRPRVSRKREDGEAEAKKRSTIVRCSVSGRAAATRATQATSTQGSQPSCCTSRK